MKVIKKPGGPVTRFTRVWIETQRCVSPRRFPVVTRFTRVWIETPSPGREIGIIYVTRFTRVWIETRPSRN